MASSIDLNLRLDKLFGELVTDESPPALISLPVNCPLELVDMAGLLVLLLLKPRFSSK
jgi:hypothetical protein